MFFNSLFLRFSFALFFSMFCALPMQAAPHGLDMPTTNKSTKRKVSESRRLPLRGPDNPSDVLATTGVFVNGPSVIGFASTKEKHESESKKNKAYHMTLNQNEVFWAEAITVADAAEEEYYRNHPRQAPAITTTNPLDDAIFWAEATRAADAAEEEYNRSRKRQASLTATENLIDDETFWAEATRAADAAVEEHFQSRQTETFLTSSSPGNEGVSSQNAPSLTSSGTQETNTSLFNLTPNDDAALYAAVIAAEEKYSQDQLSQPSSAPITFGMESSSSQMSSFPSFLPDSSSDDEAEDHFEGFRYWHLTTPQDHQQYLIDAINSAERSILITSYRLSTDMRDRSDLLKAIQSACYRGVHIYLYANEIRLGDRQLDGLERLRNLMISEARIHSKLVVVDNNQITCGSYDWLSGPWNDENASLILESSYLKPEVDNIWHVLKKYRTVDFNPHSLRRVENTLKSLDPSEIQFDNPEDSPSILNTPYQHGDLFEMCFEKAQRQLTICSPFITGHAGFLQDILPRNMLRSFLNSGKQLNIFYREGDDKVQMLKNHLDQTLSGSYYRLSQNVTLTSVKGLHRKTMFADDDLYIEGSYNWLSSARSLKDPYYFMEASLVFKGAWAQELVQEFPFLVEF